MAYHLTQLLQRSASHHPEKTVVWANGRTLTYRVLEERSNQLAHLLREHGIAKGDRIGLYFPKSVESVVSMFGILKAGAAYVPLDPQQPPSRAAYIINNCKMKGLLADSNHLTRLDCEMIPSVDLRVALPAVQETDRGDSMGWEALSGFPEARSPDLNPVSSDLAYVLYTSGSTGQPKGVMLSHQNAITFVEWCAETFRVREEDQLSNHAPLHFDLSVFDIYNAIEAGATVHMVPENILIFPVNVAKFIEEHCISIWYSVPEALTRLALHATLRADRYPKLRLILFAGEVFPIKHLLRLAQLLPTVEFYNLYGPTETNVCTYYPVDRALMSKIEKLPIGRACRNTEVFAVDDQGQRVTQAAGTGELYVRGPSVTLGYWGDPPGTEKSLVPNPFQPHFRENVYKTGDIVAMREDGDYDFLGRRDNQVKVRGHRVELGEIEAALVSHSAVAEAAAIAMADPVNGSHIRAVVALKPCASLSEGALEQHCASKIPQYMIPEIIEFRERLPRTSTGKIDRVRLASEANGGN